MAQDDLNPRSGKRTIEIVFETLVRKADPDFQRDRRNEVEYEFAGGRRIFYANRAIRGAYAPDYGSGALVDDKGLPLTTKDGTTLIYD